MCKVHIPYVTSESDTQLDCSEWSAPVFVDVPEPFWCQGVLECAASASKAKSVLRQVSRIKLDALAS